MRTRSLVNALILSPMMLHGGAWAVQVVGDPGPRSRQPALEMQSTGAMRDESNGMATGVIDAIDASAGSIVIHGVPLRFDPAKVLVFSAGGTPLSPSALQSHQSVGFVLDRTDPKHPAVRVLYLK
jgi:hypothetical protein